MIYLAANRVVAGILALATLLVVGATQNDSDTALYAVATAVVFVSTILARAGIGPQVTRDMGRALNVSDQAAIFRASMRRTAITGLIGASIGAVAFTLLAPSLDSQPGLSRAVLSAAAIFGWTLGEALRTVICDLFRARQQFGSALVFGEAAKFAATLTLLSLYGRMASSVTLVVVLLIAAAPSATLAGLAYHTQRRAYGSMGAMFRFSGSRDTAAYFVGDLTSTWLNQSYIVVGSLIMTPSQVSAIALAIRMGAVANLGLQVTGERLGPALARGYRSSRHATEWPSTQRLLQLASAASSIWAIAILGGTLALAMNGSFDAIGSARTEIVTALLSVLGAMILSALCGHGTLVLNITRHHLTATKISLVILLFQSIALAILIVSRPPFALVGASFLVTIAGLNCAMSAAALQKTGLHLASPRILASPTLLSSWRELL